MKINKLLTILGMSLIIVGLTTFDAEAKTNSKHTSKSGKKSSVVAKAKLIDAEGCDTFTFKASTYEWGSGGCDSGNYAEDNGAYILISSRQGLYLLTDDNMYHFTIDDTDAEPLVNWLASNGFDLDKGGIKRIMSYDPAEQVLNYNVDGKSGKLKISEIEPQKLKWITK